jgi:transcriptional regulator GlxA family with amidase domain
VIILALFVLWFIVPALGVTPSASFFVPRLLANHTAGLVRRVRIEEAQRLLEQTSLPVKDIAARANLGDTTTLWRIFIRYLGLTPADYRARFAARQV